MKEQKNELRVWIEHTTLGSAIPCSTTELPQQSATVPLCRFGAKKVEILSLGPIESISNYQYFIYRKLSV